MCKDCGCSAQGLMHHHHDHRLSRVVAPHSFQKLRELKVEESIFLKNQKKGNENRKWFHENGIRVFNFMSAPGSGKTALLTKILPEIQKKYPLMVVVGDQETSFDADRLRNAKVPSLQINTHSACHLDAERVEQMIKKVSIRDLKWMVIENVGNLVCPAVFDLGEDFKVAVLSVTEGEEKPLKYPVLFQDAHLIVVTKCDLLSVLDFDRDLLLKNLRSQNNRAPIIFCSAKTGDGLSEVISAMERI